MRHFIEVATLVLAMTVTEFLQSASGKGIQTSPPRNRIPLNETNHMFLLLVPDSAVDGLVQRLRYRQEEEAIEGALSFAQTSQFIGQIVQGVLGGDLRPVFAGTVGFVDDSTVQQSLGGFFQAIAPGLNLALREIYTRAQTAFGFNQTTTATPPLAQTLSPAQSQSPSGNSTVVLDDNSANITVTEKAVPTSTTAWQYVLNQIQASTTTVEPLPFLTKAPTGDEDEDYRDQNRIVFEE